jgi:hypothetical protein
MLNEKIKRLEMEKKKLVEERTGIEDRSTDDLERVTAEAVARHLAGRLLPRPVQTRASARSFWKPWWRMSLSRDRPGAA